MMKYLYATCGHRETRRRLSADAKRDRRGAAVVEFAIVAPIALLMVFAIIEFGRLMMVQHAMNTAARVACRKASLATTINSADVDTAARNFMRGVMTSATDTQKVRIAVTPSTMSNVASETPLNVAIDVNFSDITWLPAGLVNVVSNRAMRAEATFERE